MGVTQYTFSAEQYESSAATRTSVNLAIMWSNDWRKISSSKVCVLRVKTLRYGFLPLGMLMEWKLMNM